MDVFEGKKQTRLPLSSFHHVRTYGCAVLPRIPRVVVNSELSTRSCLFQRTLASVSNSPGAFEFKQTSSD